MKRSEKDEGSCRIGERITIFRRGSKWYANYQLDGKQHRKSLRTTKKKVAETKAHELDRQLAAGDRPAEVKKCGIVEAVEAYKSYLVAERRSQGTMDRYWPILDKILKLAAKLGLEWISQIDLPFADRFKAERALTCEPRTVHSDIIILRQLVKFTVKRRRLREDPLLGLTIRRPKPTPQPCFDADQVEDILRLAPPAYYSVFLLLADTGLRIGEAKWLTWQDVDFPNNVIHVRAKDGWRPKSDESRAVAMTDRLADFLRAHPRMGRFVLTASPTRKNSTPGRQISERSCLDALKRVLTTIGIPGKLHTFRHSFISRCLTDRIEEPIVRAWVGHVDPAIMRLYTHISSSVSQERIKRLTIGKGSQAAEDTPKAE